MQIDSSSTWANHTNGTSNSDHLQMASFKSPRQRGIGGVLCGCLDIEDLSISTQTPLRRHVEIRIPLEALDDPPTNAISVQ
jgi:hypothetical protein